MYIRFPESIAVSSSVVAPHPSSFGGVDHANLVIFLVLQFQQVGLVKAHLNLEQHHFSCKLELLLASFQVHGGDQGRNTGFLRVLAALHALVVVLVEYSQASRFVVVVVNHSFSYALRLVLDEDAE